MTDENSVISTRCFITAFMIISPVIHVHLTGSQYIVGSEDTHSIAEKHIKDPVVPPTLAKIRQPGLI